MVLLAATKVWKMLKMRKIDPRLVNSSLRFISIKYPHHGAELAICGKNHTHHKQIPQRQHAKYLQTPNTKFQTLTKKPVYFKLAITAP